MGAWETAEADIMKRKPRNQHVDRLVTRKLICFAYLQIGIIQAMAGFYSYLVVLSDCGYMPHTLPGLGADDNWGKQPLYCQVTGGVFRNEAGIPFPDYAIDPSSKSTKTSSSTEISTIKAINKAQARGYKFWDWRVDKVDKVKDTYTPTFGTLKKGTVKKCVHPARVVNTEDGPQKFQDKNWYDPSKMLNYLENGTATSTDTRFADDTQFKPVGAINHILALKKMNYINYMPFQGRMSAFYYSAWQKWDPKVALAGVASVHGMGRDDAANYYGSQALGYRVIPPWAKSGGRTSSWGGAPQVDTYATMKKKRLAFRTPTAEKLEERYLHGDCPLNASKQERRFSNKRRRGKVHVYLLARNRRFYYRCCRIRLRCQ